mmetsp:Transcript_16542/g.20992  ORF Transcript_16542/g.20992 Transcript_16542/m.20992 type:complete len:151 (+) Transcript_16542:184-636(+)
MSCKSVVICVLGNLMNRYPGGPVCSPPVLVALINTFSQRSYATPYSVEDSFFNETQIKMMLTSTAEKENIPHPHRTLGLEQSHIEDRRRSSSSLDSSRKVPEASDCFGMICCWDRFTRIEVEALFFSEMCQYCVRSTILMPNCQLCVREL